MVRQRLGTINKRIDVGYDQSNDTVYIHASSNCISFSLEERECLMAVLQIISFEFHVLDAITPLTINKIKLWEPAPPPAEVKL